MRKLAAVVALLVVWMAMPATAATQAKDTYRYRWEGTAIIATYTCDDGTIVAGPHPKAVTARTGTSVTAHSVEKLHNALAIYLGLGLTDKAKTFLYGLLDRVRAEGICGV